MQVIINQNPMGSSSMINIQSLGKSEHSTVDLVPPVKQKNSLRPERSLDTFRLKHPFKQENVVLNINIKSRNPSADTREMGTNCSFPIVGPQGIPEPKAQRQMLVFVMHGKHSPVVLGDLNTM